MTYDVLRDCLVLNTVTLLHYGSKSSVLKSLVVVSPQATHYYILGTVQLPVRTEVTILLDYKYDVVTYDVLTVFLVQ
jgi:hypothetical protein